MAGYPNPSVGQETMGQNTHSLVLQLWLTETQLHSFVQHHFILQVIELINCNKDCMHSKTNIFSFFPLTEKFSLLGYDRFKEEKKKKRGQARWFKPVILAIPEIRRIVV